MFTPLHELIPKAAGKRNMTRQLIAAQVCEKYRKLARHKFGDDALSHTWPKHFQQMILTVGVENSAWTQEVYMVKHHFLHEINTEFGRRVVASIKILVDHRDY